MLDPSNLTAVIVVSGVILLAILAFAFWWFYRRRCPMPSTGTGAGTDTGSRPPEPSVLAQADNRFDQLLSILPPEYLRDDESDVDDVASHRRTHTK